MKIAIRMLSRACEVAHVEGSYPAYAREGCRRLSRLGSVRLGLWEQLDGYRRSDQVMKPRSIQQHLLVRGTPERTNLLGLTPGGKGLLLHPQLDELFEAFSFGVTAASLPLRQCTPGDAKPLGQSCLCQADGRPQSQHHLAEGIVSL